jgi:hypothetical protein
MRELPIACTLTQAGTADRVEWLRRLGARSLLEGKRSAAGLALRFDPGARDEVIEWVRAERECCAFLTFDLDESGDDFRLMVAGPPGAEPVLDGLLAALTDTTATFSTP